MREHNTRLLIVLVALLGVGGANARTIVADGRGDAQSTYEPRSGPGAGQKFLEKLAGGQKWAVVKTFFPRTGDPVRVTGTCVNTMIHGGRFLRSEFEFGEGESKVTGTGLVGFDSDSGKFTSVWTDSRSTRMSIRESEGPFDGKEIRLFSRRLGDANQPNQPNQPNQRGRRSVTVTVMLDGGRKIVHRQYADPEGENRLVMEMVLTREPEGADAPAPAAPAAPGR